MTTELNFSTVVFTDLDGTLLDHDNYSYALAIDALNALEQQNIPVVINTSKTLAEVAGLQVELSAYNKLIARVPVVVENGAAVFIPREDSYGTLDLPLINGFWCKAFGHARADIQRFIADHLSLYSSEFELFEALGCEGIAAVTGLSLDDAKRANQRDFSEPMLWRGSELQKEELVSIVEKHGMTVLEGGRFLHITSGYDKGQAMLWTRQLLATHSDGELPATIALGDGGNDISMLEAADQAVVIKKPNGEHITLDESKVGTLFTQNKGPAGWAEAMKILKPKSAKSTFRNP